MRTSRESPFGRCRAAKAEAINCPRRVVLDMDSTESPVHGEQEKSAYSGWRYFTYRSSSASYT
jgi:hypothetical protein